ncbi:uncharacterized protein LW93_14239 [Fusarium fujikuroi]|nr:uncharacterized protein LW93_14239 [Fusarium fujikuroi]
MALYSSSSLTFPYPTTIRHPLQIPIRATITDARCHHGSPQVSSKTPIQVPDYPDSTNDTGVSDLSPTTGPVADGPQPTKTQAPVSDDIDAGPVEATSGFRYDSSSESARPTVETTTFQPVPDATTDAEQPQPDEMRDNSGKLFHCGGVSRQAVNVPQSTDNFSPPFAPLPLRMNVSQALGELSFRVSMSKILLISHFMVIQSQRIITRMPSLSPQLASVWLSRGGEDGDGGGFVYPLLLTGEPNAGEKVDDDNDFDQSAKKEVMHTNVPADNEKFNSALVSQRLVMRQISSLGENVILSLLVLTLILDERLSQNTTRAKISLKTLPRIQITNTVASNTAVIAADIEGA